MNKYEQLIEAIIGDDQARAKSLFHAIVVDKSRSIYESLLDAEDAGESMSSSDHSMDRRNPFNAKKRDDSEMQESKMSEVDMVMQDIVSGELDIYEVLGNPSSPTEEQAGEILQGKYDQIAADSGLHPDDDFEKIIDMLVDELSEEYSDEAVNEADDEMSDDEDEMSDDEDEMSDDTGDVEMSTDADEMSDEGDVEDRVMDLESALDELRAEFDELMAHEEEEGEMDSDAEAEEGDDEESIPDAHQDQSNAVDVMREYVEKVATPANTDQATNKTSVVAKKNDMGGTTANIARGGVAASGGKVKSPQEIDVAKRNVNKPGGNGADKFFSAKAKVAGLSESKAKRVTKSVKK